MPFQNELKSNFLTGTNNIILTGELLYWSERVKQLFAIPVGTISDCASVPQILMSATGHPFEWGIREASVLHDFLVRNGVVSRDMADLLYHDAMIDSGVSEQKADLYYAAVRFGSIYMEDKYKTIMKKGVGYVEGTVKNLVEVIDFTVDVATGR